VSIIALKEDVYGRCMRKRKVKALLHRPLEFLRGFFSKCGRRP